MESNTVSLLDIINLGNILLKFLKDEEVFIWLDAFGEKEGENRLVIDGNVWGLNEEEIKVIRRLKI